MICPKCSEEARSIQKPEEERKMDTWSISLAFCYNEECPGGLIAVMDQSSPFASLEQNIEETVYTLLAVRKMLEFGPVF